MYGHRSYKLCDGGTVMQQFNQNTQTIMNTNPNLMGNTNRGAHELMDTHAVFSGFTGAFNEYLMCEQHISDQELMDILGRQRTFMTNEYNILVEAFKTGQEPTHKTSVYNMNQSNNVQYGLTPSQPTKPNQEVSQIGDKCVSGIMMSCNKSLASSMTMAATECPNPVVRRVLADSVPNHIEMAYELFLYQNKKGFYQVAQFSPEDTMQMINSYAPIPTNPNNMMQ